MRTIDDIHLINFMELQLKPNEDFAYDMTLTSGLKISKVCSMLDR